MRLLSAARLSVGFLITCLNFSLPAETYLYNFVGSEHCIYGNLIGLITETSEYCKNVIQVLKHPCESVLHPQARF